MRFIKSGYMNANIGLIIRAQDMKLLRLKKEDTGDRKNWTRRSQGSMWQTPPRY